MLHAGFVVVEEGSLEAPRMQAGLHLAQEVDILIDGYIHAICPGDHFILGEDLAIRSIGRRGGGLVREHPQGPFVEIAPVGLGGVGPWPHDPQFLGLDRHDHIGKQIILPDIRKLLVGQFTIVVTEARADLAFFLLNRLAQIGDPAPEIVGVHA